MKKTIILTSLIASAGFANAAVALVDFSNNVNTTTAGWDVLGVSGATGNGADVAVTTLTTGWQLAIDFDNTAAVGVGGAGIAGAAGATITEANAIVDGFFIQNNTDVITLNFSNLTAGANYDFVAHTGRNGGGADATVGGVTSTWAAGGGQELSFTQQASGTGTLSFTFSSAGNNATLNALSIADGAPIPEPSSTALLGLGGLALILRRRK